jgi:hypothetical protein
MAYTNFSLAACDSDECVLPSLSTYIFCRTVPPRTTSPAARYDLAKDDAGVSDPHAVGRLRALIID